jgi:hypothetical protein
MYNSASSCVFTSKCYFPAAGRSCITHCQALTSNCRQKYSDTSAAVSSIVVCIDMVRYTKLRVFLCESLVNSGSTSKCRRKIPPKFPWNTDPSTRGINKLKEFLRVNSNLLTRHRECVCLQEYHFQHLIQHR